MTKSCYGFSGFRLAGNAAATIGYADSRVSAGAA